MHDSTLTRPAGPPRPARIALACLILLLASPAAAAPVAGFVEHFTAAGDLGGFVGQPVLTNPGTDGFGGPAEGYLQIARTQFAGQLGARNQDPAYLGNWLAAGISSVELRLKDVGGDQDLEIHFAIGNVDNFWQSNVGFSPPEGSWGTFVVDLTDSTKFTHIIDFSGGSFAGALQNVDRILIRHDQVPFAQFPNAILGEFGLDEIVLSSNRPVPAVAASWGALKGLYR